MKYRELGKTGVQVSELCMGTMTFGGAGIAQWDEIGALGESDSDAVLSRALAAGVNFIDTADMYGGGETEEILGRILGSRRDDVILATKVFSRMGPSPNDLGLSRVHVMQGLEASLRRLQTDYVDLYQVHAFDPGTPLEETLHALDDAVRQGKVRYVGCSNFAAWQIVKALGISAARDWERFVSVQAYYSMVGRDVEHEIIPAAIDAGISLLVYSPLAGGLLSGKFSRDSSPDSGARRVKGELPIVDRELAFDVIDVAKPIAERHGVSVAQVSLAWLLAQPAVTSVIVGAKRVEQLEDNLGATDLALSVSELESLGAVGLPATQYPGWVEQLVADQRASRPLPV